MEIFFDHFLLYSKNPEKIFEQLKANYVFQEIYPLRNFGYFKSGMLWIGNTKLELLYYPDNVPAPNSNNLETRFVGIALKTNLSPDATLEFLKEKGISASEILDEDVLDKNGNKVTIAKVILLNGYFKDFRIFFVFDLFDTYTKKEEELRKEKSLMLDRFEISVVNNEIVENLFNIILTKVNHGNYLDNSKIEVKISQSENHSSEISSFVLKDENSKFDLIETEFFTGTL